MSSDKDNVSSSDSNSNSDSDLDSVLALNNNPETSPTSPEFAHARIRGLLNKELQRKMSPAEKTVAIEQLDHGVMRASRAVKVTATQYGALLAMMEDAMTAPSSLFVNGDRLHLLSVCANVELTKQAKPQAAKDQMVRMLTAFTQMVADNFDGDNWVMSSLLIQIMRRGVQAGV